LRGITNAIAAAASISPAPAPGCPASVGFAVAISAAFA
jgi:hypothetical protein